MDLIVDPIPILGLPPDGNLILNPPLQGLNRVLLRRLFCLLRVPPVPGARKAVIDDGAPLSVFPYRVWHDDFRWQPGRDYDELSIAGVGTTLQGQVLGHRFSFRFARLCLPVVLAGNDPSGDRLTLDSLVCQLAEPSTMPFIIIGLWSGAIVGKRLIVENVPGSDEIQARLEF